MYLSIRCDEQEMALTSNQDIPAVYKEGLINGQIWFCLCIVCLWWYSHI